MVKRLAKDTLQSLEYIHNKGICHASMSLIFLHDICYKSSNNVLDVQSSSFIIYFDIDPYDELKVLDLFGLSENEEEPDEDLYDEVIYSLNGSGTARYKRPKATPLRIKLGFFSKGDDLNSLYRVQFAYLYLAFLFEKPPIDTESLIIAYPPPFELAFGKSLGPWIDIWFLGIVVSTLPYLQIRS